MTRTQTYKVRTQEQKNEILTAKYIYAAVIDEEIVKVNTGADGAHEIRNQYTRSIWWDRLEIFECTGVQGDTLTFHDGETAEEFKVTIEVL